MGRDLWRWMMGPSTAPSMEYRSDSALQNHNSVANPTYPLPELTPFYASVHRPMKLEEAVQWAIYSDCAMLPHIHYFHGIPDLFLQLLDATALHATASRMKAFNEEEL